MKQVVLDGAVLDRTSLHNTLSRELAFPEWYGRNLDALYDCLGDLCEETELTLRNWDAWSDQHYADRLLRVMRDAAAENDNLTISVE
ncbi:MAG: barstar family protein [Clostridiales bacterium]|nr:barstar family protein [Candidatus Cacconaster stercorequi]